MNAVDIKKLAGKILDEEISSEELREARKAFNREITYRLDMLKEREIIECIYFVDSLPLRSKSTLNAVSLKTDYLAECDRQEADDISDRIAEAFKDLLRLKRRIAYANQESNSKYFYTTPKRMKKYLDRYRPI